MQITKHSTSSLWISLALALSVISAYTFVPVVSRDPSVLPRTQSSDFSRLFLGHREFGYQIEALGVIAATVDRYATQSKFAKTGPSAEFLKASRKFDSAVESLSKLSSDQLVMPEAFLFPAMFLLFETDNPVAAEKIIAAYASTTKTETRVLLMGAFVSHLFLRDLAKSAAYYRKIASFPDIPDWVSKLADRLERNDDPFDNDAYAKRRFCQLVKKVFPKVQWSRQESDKIDAKCGGV